jgi:hypothetical protein
MKKILIGLVVIAVIVAGGLFYIWSNLGSLIKTAVEEAGSEVTQVSVTLNKVDVDNLTDGQAAIRGLTVGNPSGFQTDFALKLGEVSVKVDPSTVTSDVIVIKEVVIAAPEVTYEFGSGGSNIGTIQKNVEKAAGGASSSGGSGGSSSGGDSGGPKLVIENVYVRDGKVNVSANFLKGQKTGASLPNIHLKDIGKEGGKNSGASPAEVAQKVIAAISKAATGAVGNLNVGAIKDALGKELGGAAAGIKKSLEKGGDAGKALKEGAGEAEKGLKKLFGK